MLRKIATIFVVILLLPVFVSAQEHTVLRPDGKIYKHKGDLKNLEIMSAKQLKSEIKESHVQNISAVVYSPNGTIDTLKIPTDTWTTNFGFFGNDWFMQWFEAPADLDLLQVGFSVNNNPDAIEVSVKIVSVNWTKDQLMNAAVLNRGYYEATGNGFNDISAFMDNTDVTGGWTALDGEAEPFGADIWSDGGVGFPITPVAADADVYQWVDLSVLPPGLFQLLQGDIFGIAIRHTGLTMDANRLGWWAVETGIPAWKFYSNGRNVPGGIGVGDPGWWSRTFSWDMVVEVDLTGDRAPVISNVTKLGLTLSSDPRTVTATITDDNPGGGLFGVADAVLKYSLDDGTTWTDVTMTDMGGDVYSEDIPGQTGPQNVQYKIMATDVETNSSETLPITYNVFGKTSDILFIYNASDLSQGTASFFYIGDGTAEPLAHDFWDTGTNGVALLDVVLPLYDAVLEIGGAFPDADISGNIATWIATGTAGNPKAFLQSSQDFGCFISGCADVTFVPGDFMYDIMGVETLGPQDFSGGNNDDMQILGVDADPNSGWVNTYAAANGVDYWYNSAAELGFTNWIDNIVPTSGATTIFTEASTGNVVGVSNQGTGWYTSFLAYDYLGANFLSDTSITPLFDDPKYAWGIKVASQAFRFFTWSGVVSVERENNLFPDEYSLSQNYPNPFNPSTTIKFSVPQQSNVVLKVYDILGSEVANLVNETLDAGNYTINFDASQFASGMYVYKLTAGSFTTTKKMMLLK